MINFIYLDAETLTLYFNQNLDLDEQKQKISNKVRDLNQKVNKITTKLKKESFLRLYHEDGLRHSIRDVDSWVTKTFFALSSFK